MPKKRLNISENNLHNIIIESVNKVLKENEQEEGLRNKLATAALGATLSMSPMQGNAGAVQKKPNIELFSIYDALLYNTKRNSDIIKTAEEIMKNNSDDISDTIKQEAIVTDEGDNFLILDENSDMNYLKELFKSGSFGLITVYNDGQKFVNCVVDLTRLKEILNSY